MRVLQILSTLSFGDGVSNDCRAIKNVLKHMGYQTEIYAENIDRRLPAREAVLVSKLPKIQRDDIILYHLSTGTDLNDKILELKGKVIIRYHNITPAHFFNGYSVFAYNLCKKGYEQAEKIAKKSKYLLADSAFNRDEFIGMGFKGESEVAPILIPFDDYKKKPSSKILDIYRDKKGFNIVFVGRLAPNKMQERLIEIFYYYKKYFDKDARLFLVGSGNGMELYEQQLKMYASKLNMEDVYFTGHVKFDEILAYYQLADIFICMSEHEGFGIPLVEAMGFDKPVIALDTSAVGETLNGAGILVEEYHPLEIAGLIERLNQDIQLREQVLENQRERMKAFATEKVEKQIVEYIQKVERE